MPLEKTSFVAALLCLALAPAVAQETPDKDTPPTPLTLRITAIGGVPPERFTDDPEKAGEISIEDLKAAGAQIPPPTGGGVSTLGPEGQLPPRAEGGPFMLPENPKEYPPRPLFIGTTQDADPRYLWLTPGSTGIRFALPRYPQVSFFRQDPGGKNGEEKKPPPFYQIASGEATTHLNIFLRALPGADGWTKPHITAVDTSPAKLPPGSILFMNMSDTKLHFAVGETGFDLEPGARSRLPPGSADARGMARIEVEALIPGADPLPVSKTQRRISGSDRLIVVPYRDRFAKDPLHRIRLIIYRDSAEPASLPAERAGSPK